MNLHKSADKKVTEWDSVRQEFQPHIFPQWEWLVRCTEVISGSQGGVILPLRGHLAMSRDILVVATEKKILASKTRNVAKYLTIHRSSPAKNYLALSVNSAMVEKPCPWIFRTRHLGPLKQALQCDVGGGSASQGEPRV